MAAHGVGQRATLDLDLFALDPLVLQTRTWSALRDRDVSVELRFGDDDDPLAGVVRIDEGGAEPVDVVVGRSPAWQQPILDRARATTIDLRGVKVPLVDEADLVLLKLYAGGPRDRRDIEDLLALPNGGRTADVVGRRVAGLPDDCRTLWARIRQGRSASPR